MREIGFSFRQWLESLPGLNATLAQNGPPQSPVAGAIGDAVGIGGGNKPQTVVPGQPVAGLAGTQATPGSKDYQNLQTQLKQIAVKSQPDKAMSDQADYLKKNLPGMMNKLSASEIAQLRQTYGIKL